MKKSFLVFLKKYGADLKKHSLGRSLLDHLLGTYNLLDSWQAPKHVSIAGLFHSVYGNEYFTENLLDMNERGLLTELIGKDAELLVYYFNACNRRQTLKNAKECVTKVVEVNNQQTHILPRAQFSDLILLIFANELEQTPEFSKLPDKWKAHLIDLFETSKPYLNNYAMKYFQDYRAL